MFVAIKDDLGLPPPTDAQPRTIVQIFDLIQPQLQQVEQLLRTTPALQHYALTAAIEHIVNSGGKRVRPALALLTAGALQADWQSTVYFATAIEMLHTATLVHDDLIDGALLRRGIPTLNTNWTPAATILTGDYIFARAASLAAQTGSVQVIELFAQALMIIVNGELQQQFTSKSSLSRSDYEQRIYAKTASLFELATAGAAALAGLAASEQQRWREFGKAIGMAFQIIDDILDYVATTDTLGKPAGSDLQQGLFTLPALYYAEAHPADPNIALLRQPEQRSNRPLINAVVESVRQSGAITAAHQEACQYVAQAKTLLSHLPNSPYLAHLFALADYFVQRSF